VDWPVDIMDGVFHQVMAKVGVIAHGSHDE
jgi:hypothetical protein